MIVAQHEAALILQREHRRKDRHAVHDLAYQTGKADVVAGVLLRSFGDVELGRFQQLREHQTGTGRGRADVAFPERRVHAAQRVGLGFFQDREQAAQPVTLVLFFLVQ